jgi:CRISPR/Cas system-associated exonuclease Cas4 (RecB family)
MNSEILSAGFGIQNLGAHPDSPEAVRDCQEYLCCPRFIYFMKCLDIPQHEDKRYKVIKGREVHEEKSKINREYLRKKLGCVSKDISAYLASSALHKNLVREILDIISKGYCPKKKSSPAHCIDCSYKNICV